MARTPKNHAAAAGLGAKLAELHDRYEKRHGPTSYERIARLIEFQFDVVMSDEHVRKYHRGENDPYAMRVDELIAFAKFYKVKPAKLGPDAALLIKRVSDLVTSGFGWLLGSPVAA